ncbi:MAG TPA: quinol:electron acceptor oxidoreductase subunit ActD [Kofleriaceae bacterium]|nr:quinol:electron acceptor oxidoreductase subunit ActD [Kofleriaceae bacterium]
MASDELDNEVTAESDMLLPGSETVFYGLLAEYDSPGALLQAAEQVRDAGYEKWDCHAPYPVHGLDPAMGIRSTILPVLVFAGGITGTATAILMQWWMNARAWQWVASGKPYFSVAQQIPIAFELTVLFSAFTAFWGMWFLNKLPQVWHPLFRKKRFLKASSNGFFISVESQDPSFRRADTEKLLREAGAVAVEEVSYTTSPEQRNVPRPLLGFILLTTVLALVPFAFIAKYRTTHSDKPHFYIVGDMDFQQKRRPQSESDVFADSRADRVGVAGTVARGELKEDDHFYRGLVDGEWATTFPPQLEISERRMREGEERFQIYCTPCHGQAAAGNGMIHQRAMAVGAGATGWVQPLNLVDTTAQLNVVRQPHGQIFNTISNGIRTMPGYKSQIPEMDRWKIVLYLRAIQRSRNASIEDVPPSKRPALR